METINSEVISSIAGACGEKLKNVEIVKDYTVLVSHLEQRLDDLEKQNTYLKRMLHAE